MKLTDDVLGHLVEHRRLRAHTRERVDFDAWGVYKKLVCGGYTITQEVLKSLVPGV